MPYLMWYDDSPARPVEAKIRAAIMAYTVRFGAPPTVVLVSEADAAPAEVDGVVTRTAGTIRPRNFWAGREEG